MNFPEQDWRLLRSVSRAALDRFCSRVLDECAAIIRGDGSAHERYTPLYELLHERDAGIAAAFDDLRRSTAVQRLAAMINLDVVTDAELGEFTAPTRESARVFADIVRPRGKRRNGR